MQGANPVEYRGIRPLPAPVFMWRRHVEGIESIVMTYDKYMQKICVRWILAVLSALIGGIGVSVAGVAASRVVKGQLDVAAELESWEEINLAAWAGVATIVVGAALLVALLLGWLAQWGVNKINNKERPPLLDDLKLLCALLLPLASVMFAIWTSGWIWNLFAGRPSWFMIVISVLAITIGVLLGRGPIGEAWAGVLSYMRNGSSDKGEANKAEAPVSHGSESASTSQP